MICIHTALHTYTHTHSHNKTNDKPNSKKLEQMKKQIFALEKSKSKKMQLLSKLLGDPERLKVCVCVVCDVCVCMCSVIMYREVSDRDKNNDGVMCDR